MGWDWDWDWLETPEDAAANRLKWQRDMREKGSWGAVCHFCGRDCAWWREVRGSVLDDKLHEVPQDVKE